MSFQVPAVTIEDLQAFQTKNFPGAHAHPTEETNQSCVEGGDGAEEEYYYYDDTEEDYDLGYYPDGAKRTLTDEQIRIFRHSEIHALRREKQEREEEEEEHAGSLREASQSTNAGGGGQDGASGHVGSNESRMESVKANAGSETATTLDYGGGLQVNSRPQHPASSVPFTGRKIVSYED